jgi:phenylacetate-CoA ligase
VAEVARRHPAITRLRVVVRRENEQDQMLVMAEAQSHDSGLEQALAQSIKDVTKLSASISWHAPGSLPNDGKVIADERPIG